MLHFSRGLASTAKTEGGKPWLKVVIVFEDFEAGKHARKTYEYLSSSLGDESDFTESMWGFEVLTIPKLREVAAKDAAEADLVVVSSHGGQELPTQVKEWVEQWLALRGRPLALVALFDCNESEAAGVRSYLSTVARRAGVQFFAQPCSPSSPAKKAPKPPPISNYWEPPARSLQPGDSIPRWGINE